MKISSLIYCIFCLFLNNIVYAFNVGEGSEFIMSTEGQKVELSIYISKVKNKNIGVEFHFGSGGLFTSNMWQQFEMDISKSQGIQIQKGYIKTAENEKPEILLKKHFYMNEGVQVQDFLFSNENEIKKDFVAHEMIEIPAGTIKASHYRKIHDGQTVDFWISDQVKPIGLVKLISKSKVKKTNNYTIELNSLLKNVKPAINSQEAIPMGQKTKKLLSRAAK